MIKKDFFKMTTIITENCNFACKYCYVKEHRGSMTIETLNKVVDYVEGFIKQGKFVAFDLFGGEPLLEFDTLIRPICLQRLDDLYSKYPGDFIATIFTNGSLLTEEILNFTKVRKYINYNFSLDGNKHIHDKTRVYHDGSGTYNDVERGIKLYSKVYGIPREYITAKTIISPYNYKDMLNIVKYFVEDIGLKRIDLTYDRSNVWNGLVDSYKNELMKVAEYYIQNINKGLFFDIFSIPIIDYNIHKGTYCSCGKNQWGIAPNGDIYPCQRFYNNNSHYKFGNVFTGIDKNNQFYKLFKYYNIDNITMCKKCDYFNNSNCFGQCPAACYEANKSILIPIPNVCGIIKATYDVSMHVYNKLKDNPIYLKTLNLDNYSGM